MALRRLNSRHPIKDDHYLSLELFKGDSIFRSNKVIYLEKQQLNRMLYKVPKVNAKMEPSDGTNQKKCHANVWGGK